MPSRVADMHHFADLDPHLNIKDPDPTQDVYYLLYICKYW
jgi:hypothetical protein